MINVFDKGYVNHEKWKECSQKGAYFVTRLNDNADYQVVEGKPYHISDYADGGVISDQIILLNPSKEPLKARLIKYKDPESGKVLEFVSNMFDHSDITIIMLYKYRWNIEVMFKQLKQNFGVFLLGQQGRDSDPGLAGLDSQFIVYYHPQKKSGSRAVYHNSQHGFNKYGFLHFTHKIDKVQKIIGNRQKY